LWDVDTRKKLRTIIGGSAVALSADGRLLVKDGKDGGGIELYEVATGTLRTIPRILKRAENTVTKFTLSPDGNLLAVTANGDDDMVYDVPLGKLLTTLANTKFAQFSNDGSLLIGGNNRHLIAWSTKDWSEVRDLPRGPDYVRQIAVSPERDLVIVGGPKVAVLQRLSSGEEIARLGEGFTNFLSFNASGTLVFTYSGTSGFVVWDTSGRPYCASQRMGSTLALSADGRWLADASPTTAGAVRLWNIPGALRVCGAPEK
jgi:WD40 repeat protein